MNRIDLMTPLAGPDEPEHPRQCKVCHCYLPRFGWEFEERGDRREPDPAWLWDCKGCGTMNVHEG